MSHFPAAINGVSPSRLRLPPGVWQTLLDGLCAQFPAISRGQWLDRFERGRVLDFDGTPITMTAPYCAGVLIHYYREVVDELRISVQESVLYVDEHLVVADKPHFLPVMPAGSFVEQTLLARLVERLGNEELVPLHRIDRDTAGLVMFSANRSTRDLFHAVFRNHAISKHYEALAPPLSQLQFPLLYRSRLLRGTPFFRICEGEGTANSETRIDVIERGETHWRYALAPITGRKHQLRVHMAALGAPIQNDRWYPSLCAQAPDDSAHPLQLLAKSLAFVDPTNGELRHFESEQKLDSIA